MPPDFATLAPQAAFQAPAIVRPERLQIETELRTFVQALSHELRAPVSAMIGFAKVLDEILVGDAPERVRHCLVRIRAASEQLDGYLEALTSLTQAAGNAARVMDVDVSALGRAALEDMKMREPARSVTWHVQPGMRACGDPALLRMLVDNLLGNAWKFTSRTRGAHIEFTATPGSGCEPTYCVRDNGAGFDDAYAHKLFNDFQRLHSQCEFPGTGLGLSNVRRIVTRHGGRVWAHSAPGPGASFFFTLGGQGIGADPGRL